MSDEDVRRMLHRRAEDVAPSPEAWASIEARLDAPAPEPSRPPSRRPLVAVAVVVVLLAGLAVAVGARPDGSGEVVTATEGPAEESTGPGAGGEPASVPEDAPASTADEPAPAPGTPLPAPGAPVLLRSKATVTQQQQQQGYSQGTITLVFDQPVEPGTAMNLVLYGDDPTCAGPAGNSHVVLSGAGTPSITFDATSLGVPTSYITIFPGFVTGTGSGAANAAVPCTRVPTEVSLAPTTTTTPGPPGPVLTGVTARVTERQGSYAQGTITVTFDQPVRLAGPEPLAAMYLLVFGDDSGCSLPQGNSHRVISGNGTPTLTLDATSLASPTTYVVLAPGFVEGVESGAPNEALGCTAVPTG